MPLSRNRDDMQTGGLYKRHLRLCRDFLLLTTEPTDSQIIGSSFSTPHLIFSHFSLLFTSHATDDDDKWSFFLGRGSSNLTIALDRTLVYWIAFGVSAHNIKSSGGLAVKETMSFQPCVNTLQKLQICFLKHLTFGRLVSRLEYHHLSLLQ